jgi:hypothetical protein
MNFLERRALQRASKQLAPQLQREEVVVDFEKAEVNLFTKVDLILTNQALFWVPKGYSAGQAPRRDPLSQVAVHVDGSRKYRIRNLLKDAYANVSVAHPRPSFWNRLGNATMPPHLDWEGESWIASVTSQRGARDGEAVVLFGESEIIVGQQSSGRPPVSEAAELDLTDGARIAFDMIEGWRSVEGAVTIQVAGGGSIMVSKELAPNAEALERALTVKLGEPAVAAVDHGPHGPPVASDRSDPEIGTTDRKASAPRKLPTIRTQADLDRALAAKSRPRPEELSLVSAELEQNYCPNDATGLAENACHATAELALLSAKEIDSIDVRTGKGWMLDTMAAAGSGYYMDYDLYLQQASATGHDRSVLDASFMAAEAFFKILGGFDQRS